MYHSSIAVKNPAFNRGNLHICNCSNTPTISTQPNQQFKFSIPTHFQRLVAKRTGNSFREVAEVVTKELRLPQEDEVLVKVKYAGINGGCETFRARGDYFFQKNKQLPELNLGADCVGQIVYCGSSVTDLEVGQNVITNSGNGFSEYVTVKPKQCTQVLQSSPQMAAMGVSGFFSGAIFQKYGLHLKPNDIVLVTAAAGAAGSFAVQIGKKYGCHVIGTCGNSKKANLLKQLNIDRIINYNEECVDDVLSKQYPKGVDFVMEGVGGQLRDIILKHLAPNGKMVCTGYISQYPHNTQQQQQYVSSCGLPQADSLFWGFKDVELEDGKIVHGGGFVSLDLKKAKILEWYNKGEIIAVVDDQKSFNGLESIVDAIDYMLTGEALGKVVVQIQ